MNRIKGIIIGSTVFLILAFIGYTIWLITRPQPVQVQGEVDATQVRVASKLTGRIDSVLIHKGQQVDTGTLLFTINSPEVNAKLMQAEAAWKAADAQKSKAYNGARNEDIQAAFNSWQKAKAAATFARKTYERINNLFNDGVVPEQKKDEAETKMEAALQTEKAARAVYEKAKEGARLEDKHAAGALVQKAEGAVHEVQSYVQETRIKAPRKGEIANIMGERGELIPAGYPIVTLVDLDDVWVTFNLTEDLLADIRKGDVIKARFPAIGGEEVKLKITYIHSLGEFATWTATKTSGDFDMKTFEVHARPVHNVDGLRPGMSALVNWSDIKRNS
jgi:HlyD family secretion protein